MKKLPTLHILNGDASLPAFTSAKIQGKVLVWREVLSEGPVVATVPELEFWRLRQQYITSVYNEPAAAYKQKVLDELPKIEAAGAFFEVVLWFDADLMCQINLLYLLFRLQQVKPAVVSVCTPAPYMNVAMLQPAALSQLFNERQQLSTAQLDKAQALWTLYAGPDPMQLQRYLQQNVLLLPHLNQALRLHLSRFPDCNSGLGLPEKELLLLLKAGTDTKDQLMHQFWKQHPAYGFGDWQLLSILKSMQPGLFQEKEEKVELTVSGKQVVEGKAVYTLHGHWLGGVKVGESNTWCYQPENQQLQII